MLGLSKTRFACSLGFACARSLSAATVLFLQGYLLFRRSNPLLGRHLENTGEHSSQFQASCAALYSDHLRLWPQEAGLELRDVDRI